MARILIIDDSATVASAVAQVLAADGHLVEHLDMFVNLPVVLGERRPDLIILDLEMPGIPGVRLAKLLARLTTRKVPVCVYSSRPLVEIEAAAREMGAAAGLEKSRPMAELRRLVSELLGGRGA